MILIIFILGLIFGSFLNVCIYRIPRGESIFFPPSRCPNCKITLKVKDLFPLISYGLKRGRCSYCGEKISLRYPLMEGITGILYVLIYLSFGFSIEFIFYIGLTSLLLIIAGIDYDHQVIPDPFVMLGLGGGLLYHFIGSIMSHGLGGIVHGFIGLVIGGGFLLLIAVLSKGGMGGGDIKLMGMLGFWLGWKLTIIALFFSFLFGGLISIFLLACKIKNKKDMIPFGPFLCLGTFVSLLYGNVIFQWYLQLFL